MSARPIPTAERWRRFLRDKEAYRQRSAWRRSDRPRFFRYLGVLPHVFLVPGAVFAAPLCAPWPAVVEALRGRAVFTLDTAARLRFGVGLFRTGDATGYAEDPRGALEDLAARGLAGAPLDRAPAVDPALPRPPLAILAARPPDSFRLETGDLVVRDDRLVEDLLGTVGFRPDLLARLEARGLVPHPRAGMFLRPPA